MNVQSLHRRQALVALLALLVLVIALAGPALARVSAYDDEEKGGFRRNPYVMPYVIAVGLTGLVLWVTLRSSRRQPV